MIKYQFSVYQADDSRKWTQYLCAFSATVLAFACGTSLGWSSPVKSSLTSTNHTSYDFHVSESEMSWIGSSLALSATLTCVPSGYLIYWIGRKWSLLLLSIPVLVGWAVILFAKNFLTIVFGRIILGAAVGGAFVIIPVYIGEIAQREIRGRLGTMFQLMVTFGILFVYTVGAFVDVFALTLICLVIPIVFAAVFVWMPESPTYLVNGGKLEQAVNTFGFLRGWTHDNHSEIERLKYEEEQRQLVNQNRSLKVSFSRVESRKALMIIIGLYVFHQLCGINAVIFNATAIFEKANKDISPPMQTIGIGLIQFLMTLASVFGADKAGRKIMLFLSQILMTITTLGLGIYFFLKKDGTTVDPTIMDFTTMAPITMADTTIANITMAATTISTTTMTAFTTAATTIANITTAATTTAATTVADSLVWLPMTSLSLFIIGYSIGQGPLVHTMIGEICAPDIKGFAIGVALSLNWFLTFCITKFFSNLQITLGIHWTFWIFSGFSLLGAAFVCFCVPETKGKSLNAIQRMLAGIKEPPQEEEEGDQEKEL